MKAIFEANDELILISMAWWINRTFIFRLLKIWENHMQNHCITQNWWYGVPSFVLTFWKTIMEMLWLWTPSATRRWSTTSLCLNYNENIGWLIVWVLWHINLFRLFNFKYIFIKINCSISNNSVQHKCTV